MPRLCGSDCESVWKIEPAERSKPEWKLKWPLEKGAFWLHELLLRICPFWWLIDRCEKEPRRDKARVAWVLTWTVALIAFWAWSPEGSLNDVLAVLAVVRLLEVFASGLGTVLDRDQQAGARSLITIAIYAAQVTFIFAIVDHSWASTGFAAVHGGHAMHRFDFLYISWTSMTTLNNTYEPEGVAPRLFQMLNATSGILLLGVLLAFGINQIPKEAADEKEGPKGAADGGRAGGASV